MVALLTVTLFKNQIVEQEGNLLDRKQKIALVTDLFFAAAVAIVAIVMILSANQVGNIGAFGSLNTAYLLVGITFGFVVTDLIVLLVVKALKKRTEIEARNMDQQLERMREQLAEGITSIEENQKQRIEQEATRIINEFNQNMLARQELELEKINQAKETFIQNLENEKASMKEQYGQFQELFSKAKEKLKSFEKEIDKLKPPIKQTVSTIKNLKLFMEKCLGEDRELASNIFKAKSETGELENDARIARRTLKTIQNELDEQNNQLDDLKSERAHLAKELDALDQSLKRTVTSLHLVSAEQKESQRENSNLSEVAKSSEFTCREYLEMLEKRLEMLEKRLTECESFLS